MLLKLVTVQLLWYIFFVMIFYPMQYRHLPNEYLYMLSGRTISPGSRVRVGKRSVSDCNNNRNLAKQNISIVNLHPSYPKYTPSTIRVLSLFCMISVGNANKTSRSEGMQGNAKILDIIHKSSKSIKWLFSEDSITKLFLKNLQLIFVFGISKFYRIFRTTFGRKHKWKRQALFTKKNLWSF